MELNKKCGQRLKECIKAKEMTLKELSAKVNFTMQYISNIANGKKPMTVTAAKAFSKYLGVSEAYLLCESDYKTEAEYKSACKKSYTNSMECCFAYLETIGIHIKFVNVAPGNNTTEAFWCASSEEFQKDYEILPDDCVKVDQYTFVEISSNDYDIVLSPVAFWNFFPNIENFVHFAVENFLDNLQCCYRNSKIDLSDPDTEIGLIKQIHQP